MQNRTKDNNRNIDTLSWLWKTRVAQLSRSIMKAWEENIEELKVLEDQIKINLNYDVLHWIGYNLPGNMMAIFQIWFLLFIQTNSQE